jgi:hypothetical protein
MKIKNRAVPFSLVFLIPFMLIQLYGFSIAYAELPGNSIPTGKEIKDPYLEKLFAPEFPYESLKVIVTKEENKYLIVRAKEIITDEIRQQYEKETLRKRKISLTRYYAVQDKTLAFSEMVHYRVVSEIPYTVEYSNMKGRPLGGNRYDDVLKHAGQFLVISINEEFGKAFKKVTIYPDKETSCLDPPLIDKYAGSKSIASYEDDKILTFILVAKAKPKDIYDYYKDKVNSHYKKIGLNYPESKWNIGDMRSAQLGIKIKTIRLSELGPLLKLMELIMKQEVTQLFHHGPELKRLTKNSRIPVDDLILSVQINKGDECIPDYSFIKIFCSIDPDLNKRTLEKINTQSKDRAK